MAIWYIRIFKEPCHYSPRRGLGKEHYLCSNGRGSYVPDGYKGLYSRYVVNWSLSNTMDRKWGSKVVNEVIDQHGDPEIMNSDQGAQFTSEPYLSLLKRNNVKISKDGKVEPWIIFSLKDYVGVSNIKIYARPSADGTLLYCNLRAYLWRFNGEDPKAALGYWTVSEYYCKNVA